MNKAERQDTARKRPLIRQPTVAELHAKAYSHFVELLGGWRSRDQRNKPEHIIDDRIARAARRRRHQRRGR